MKKLKLAIPEFRKIIIKNIKKYQWLINFIWSLTWIILAWLAIFIAYPEYQEFIEKNKIPDLNWNRNIEFITEDSNLSQYKWMNDQYDVFLIWAKDEYKWKWEKWKSFDNIIKHEKRPKIEFEIVIKWNNVYGFYSLIWSRETAWNMEVILNSEWTKFEGNFVTSAADSKWKVIWTKK